MGGKILRRVEKDIKDRIKDAKKIIFFLDYDGTLTPIRKKPSLARIDKNTKNFLKKLASNVWSKVFVISGRSLKDIKSILNVNSLYYIGNHGIELKGPDLKYINRPATVLKPFIQKSYKALKKILKFKGVILENKIYTLSLHYRLAEPGKIPLIKNAYMSAIKDFLKSKKVKITEGKKVFEIRPNIRWDKGKIVNWVLKKIKTKNVLPICIGDDKTDEDIFKTLGKRGISILVSKRRRKTAAQYRLSSYKDVINFLEFVIQSKRGGDRFH